MGDYPLKRSSSYRVPENMRINTEKKRRQRILLIESIYNIKAEFNARVLAIRDVKEKSVAWIQKANQRAVEINRIVNVDEPLLYPALLVTPL
jgi:protein subunit release factor B